MGSWTPQELEPERQRVPHGYPPLGEGSQGAPAAAPRGAASPQGEPALETRSSGPGPRGTAGRGCLSLSTFHTRSRRKVRGVGT